MYHINGAEPSDQGITVTLAITPLYPVVSTLLDLNTAAQDFNDCMSRGN